MNDVHKYRSKFFMDINLRELSSNRVLILFAFSLIFVMVTPVESAPHPHKIRHVELNPCGVREYSKPTNETGSKTINLFALKKSLNDTIKPFQNKLIKNSLYKRCNFSDMAKETPLNIPTVPREILKKIKEKTKNLNEIIHETMEKFFESQWVFYDAFTALQNVHFDPNSAKIKSHNRPKTIDDQQIQAKHLLCEIEDAMNMTAIFNSSIHIMRPIKFKGTDKKVNLADICSLDIGFYNAYEKYLTEWYSVVKQLSKLKSTKKVVAKKPTAKKVNPKKVSPKKVNPKKRNPKKIFSKKPNPKNPVPKTPNHKLRHNNKH